MDLGSFRHVFWNHFFEIFTCCANGCVETRLTNNPGLESRGPSWSPDGSQTVYSSRVDGNAEIYMMNADGSQPFAITTSGNVHSPVWSPDGATILFALLENGRYRVWLITMPMAPDSESGSTLLNAGSSTWPGVRVVD